MGTNTKLGRLAREAKHAWRTPLLVALATALAPWASRAAGPDPRPPASTAASEPTPGEPTGGRCAADPESASLAVKLAFSDLVNIHRGRIPGPSGQRVLDDKVDELLARMVDLERFTMTALSSVWAALDPARQRTWQDNLLVGLRGHYLRRLTEAASPVGQRLDVGRAEVSCDRATVDLTLGRRDSHDHTEVSLRMLWTGARWRAFDVSVDGVSLAETWRNRFRQIYKDGGLDAVDEHLQQLAERHRR